MKELIKANFTSIMKDFFLPKLFVILPLILFLIMPWAAEQDFRHLKVCVVDNDRSTFSSRLIQAYDGNRLFDVTAVTATYEETLAEMERANADFIVVFPQDFERTLAAGMADLDISANTCNMMKGGLGSSYLTNITMEVVQEFRQENLANINAPRPMQMSVSTQYLYNPKPDYKRIMVPILLVILLTLVGGFLPALHRFYLPQPAAMSDGSAKWKVQSFIASLIPYFLIGEVLFLLSIGIVILYLGFVPSASAWGGLILWSSLYLLLLITISLLIGKACRNSLQAMLWMFFIVLTSILMSGLFTPVGAMPGWAQSIAKVNPVQYLIQTMRTLYFKV